MSKVSTRYAIYARVSERGSSWHEKGIDSSLDSQVDECRRYVSERDKGATIARVVRDEFMTAATNERPGLRSLLAEVTSGKAKWDTLIVISMDRLTRSIVEATKILEPLHEHGKGLVSVKENWDFSSPVGRMMMWQIIVWSEFFRVDMGDKTRRKMEHIARQGLWPAGHTPYGYRRAGKRDNRLVPVPDEAARVHEAFRRYADGNTMQTISDASRGGLKRKALDKVLRNPIYIGRLKYGDIDVQGQHEAIVPLALWRTVQERLPHTRTGERPNARTHEYLLTGLIECQCGRLMTPCYGRGKGGKRWYYYRCDDKACHDNSYVRADLMENAILEQVAAIPMDTDALAGLARDIRRRFRTAQQAADPELKRTAAAIKKLEAERENLRGMMRQGLVTASNAGWVNADLARLDMELTNLEQRRQELKAQATRELGGLDTPEGMAKAWATFAGQITRQEGDRKKIRGVIRLFIRRIYRREKGLFDVEYVLAKTAGGSTNLLRWHPDVVLVELRLAG